MLKIKRICDNIWKLIEKRQQLRMHLVKRKQDPDCHESGKTWRLEKVLFEKKKKEEDPVAMHQEANKVVWLPDPEISVCIAARFLL